MVPFFIENYAYLFYIPIVYTCLALAYLYGECKLIINSKFMMSLFFKKFISYSLPLPIKTSHEVAIIQQKWNNYELWQHFIWILYFICIPMMKISCRMGSTMDGWNNVFQINTFSMKKFMAASSFVHWARYPWCNTYSWEFCRVNRHHWTFRCFWSNHNSLDW